MMPIDFQLRTRLVLGVGKIQSLGELASEFAPRRILLVTDPGVLKAGHAQHAIDAIEKWGIDTRVFSKVDENPTTSTVESGLEFAKNYRPEMIIAVGGGSSMDCAKGINFLLTNGGKIADYWGTNKATRPLLPMIAVPTTAGTGSESQSFALISDPVTHVKMACGDRKAAFRIAILDPELTLTQPPRVTAITGIDALSHALETYVTNVRNPISVMFSREAWRHLSTAFPRVLKDPADLEARGAMQLGAFLAGLAIENSMLGATHALANPLTATHDIPHGQAIALMLPHVIRYNGATCNHWYQELQAVAVNGHSQNGSALVAGVTGGSPRSSSDWLADFVGKLVQAAGLESRLSTSGVVRDNLPKLAEDASRQWTGTFNPRKVEVGELLSLYEQAW